VDQLCQASCGHVGLRQPPLFPLPAQQVGQDSVALQVLRTKVSLVQYKYYIYSVVSMQLGIAKVRFSKKRKI